MTKNEDGPLSQAMVLLLMILALPFAFGFAVVLKLLSLVGL